MTGFESPPITPTTKRRSSQTSILNRTEIRNRFRKYAPVAGGTVDNATLGHPWLAPRGETRPANLCRKSYRFRRRRPLVLNAKPKSTINDRRPRSVTSNSYVVHNERLWIQSNPHYCQRGRPEGGASCAVGIRTRANSNREELLAKVDYRTLFWCVANGLNTDYIRDRLANIFGPGKWV